MSKLRIAIAADHAGFKLKEDLVEYLGNSKYIIKDFGTFSDESVDYPDFGHTWPTSLHSVVVDWVLAQLEE